MNDRTPHDLERLSQLITAGHACVRIVSAEEADVRALMAGVAIAVGKRLLAWSCVQGVVDGLVEGGEAAKGTDNAAAAALWLARNAADQLCLLVDLSAAMLNDHVAARSWRELVEAARRRGGCVVMLDSADQTLPVVKTLATPFEAALPDEPALEQIVRNAVLQMKRRNPVEVKMSRPDLATIVKNLKGLAPRQAEQIIRDVISEDRTFNIYDLNSILARKRQMMQSGGLLEYVKSPVDMDAIGGLGRLKGWLTARKDALHDEARAFGIDPPRGVLILGVQGSGKSLCAKAIATAWQRPLLRLDMGALYDKFIGESERNLREALHQAESMAPNVLWFDEIEKAFAGTGSSGGGSDSGLSKRMFGMLLTWMQEHRSAVFVAATANDIDSLPPELMRKGRFDEIFFVDLPSAAAREAIFRIHLSKKKRDPATFDLPALVAASDGFSGAEIEQAVQAALHRAFGDQRRELATADLLYVLGSSPPLSVTRAEKLAALRRWAQGRCVPAE